MTAPWTDHHVHLMSTVAARLSVDVSAARSVAEVGEIVRRRAPAGRSWVRAWGYEEWRLAEGRHPTRPELDAVLPGRPLVLHHRSGHAAVLNTPALGEVGADAAGDGLLVDRHEALARVPRLAATEMAAAATAVSAAWAAAGVGGVVDATHTNGPGELETFAAWCSAGRFGQRITAMISRAALAASPPYGSRVGAVTVGPVKLMPDPERLHLLAEDVAAAHAAGFPVAVHVVETEVLESVLAALGRSPAPAGTCDRVEHNALCLPEQVPRLAASGARVVVNPSFLTHRRVKYDAEVSDVERPWLVRIGSLLRSGIEVRAGSDSPVTPSRPAEMIAAATAHPFSPDESVTRAQAEALLSPWPA